MHDRPSAYQLGAALIVARLIDEAGNTQGDAQETYRLALTQGEYPALQLQVGERILLDIGLLAQHYDRLHPTPALHVVAGTDDATALELLSSCWGEAAEKADTGGNTEDRRSRVGALGEEFVAQACRDELQSLGRPDLAGGVQRVSLVSDALGYDILAPAMLGHNRQLEVKTASWQRGMVFRFFLTRNEFETGRRHADVWALVACRLRGGTAEGIDVLGWCRVDTLGPYLPEDRQGRWTEALVSLPVAALVPGVPPAI